MGSTGPHHQLQHHDISAAAATELVVFQLSPLVTCHQMSVSSLVPILHSSSSLELLSERAIPFRLLPLPLLFFHEFNLNIVLVSPNLIKNLIFAHQFTFDNNYSVEFDPLCYSVKDLLS